MSERKQVDNNTWKTISTRIAYKNPWIQIKEDKIIRPDGTEGLYGIIETQGPSVFIIPITSDNKVHLIHQYRYPTKTYSWEVPAGSSDKQEPLIAAKRELLEETGLTAKKWQQIGSMQALGGLCSEISYIFLAQNLTQTGNHEQLEEGITEAKAIPLSEILNMIKDGRITDSQTIAAIFQVTLFLDNK